MEPSSLVSHQTSQHFSLDEIQAATENFNEELVIGRGGFGMVYKGHINHGSGTPVAIKRLSSKSNQGAPEFHAEVEMLSKLRHCNLVSLIGTQHGVIHRDVKSSNILLDENFSAKISDFGLAKIGPTNQTCTYVSTGVKGTFGYMDPCYFYSGKLTRKSDVYSFGVVLLEVLCGRHAVDSSLDEEQWGLAAWVQDRIKDGKLNRIADSRIRDQISSNSLKQFANLACRCLHNQPNRRPSMTEIVARFELILSLQEKKLDSSVTDGKFINKLWSFFPAKVQLKTSKWISGPIASKAAAQLIHFDASSFTLEEVQRTSAEAISNSNYWKAYRATMESGEEILVRRMKTELLLEEDIVLGKIHALGKIRHINILRPKAYYHGKDEAFYITDYIQNGSISSFLHSPELQEPLGWLTRRSIIVGITRGLVYLHTQEDIVHGYLTSENALLDRNYNPLMTDVGLLLLLTDDARPKSPLNHAPELLKFEDANKKTDVYSLGLIMLELLTRKSSNSEKHEIDLPGWLMSIPREKLTEVFDPELTREKRSIRQDLVRMLELAMACVTFSPNARPEAYEVLQQLEEIVAMAMYFVRTRNDVDLM